MLFLLAKSDVLGGLDRLKSPIVELGLDSFFKKVWTMAVETKMYKQNNVEQMSVPYILHANCQPRNRVIFFYERVFSYGSTVRVTDFYSSSSVS